MAEKQPNGAGLRGQVAGKTALSTVGKSGSGLTYRGYDVKDLAENCQFEEVAHLILKGALPTQAELDAYKKKLKGLRGLPQALKEVLERIPKDAHPMDVMRTGCSVLGNLETETSFDQQQDATDRMLAAEITREQLYHQLHAELPYAAAVDTEQYKEREDGSVEIHQQILVARPTQRAIVLGKGGQRLKEIGSKARAELATLLGVKVHLYLHVKVKEDWEDDRFIYRDIGLDWVE